MNYLLSGKRKNKLGNTLPFRSYYLRSGIICLWLFLIMPVSAQDLRDLYITPIESQTVCQDDNFALINFTANTSSPGVNIATGNLSFEWKLSSGVNVTDFTSTLGSVVRPSGSSSPTVQWDPNNLNLTNKKTGTGEYEVTPVWNNQKGQSTKFTLTRTKKPVIEPLDDFRLCNGDPLKVNFISNPSDTQVKWELMSNISRLGIPLKGMGNIDLPKLQHSTASTIKETIRVIPYNEETQCYGDTIEFSVAVLPTPTVNQPENVFLVPGETSLGKIEFTGIASLFEWTSSNPAIGTAASGTVFFSNGKAFMPPFKAQDTGVNPARSKITVTPIYSSNGGSCSGTPAEFYITVVSMPTLDVISNQTACDGEYVDSFAPSGLSSGEGYYITWTGGADIGLPDETGDNRYQTILPFIAKTINNTKTDKLITVTPHLTIDGRSFAGTPVRFTFTVYSNMELGRYAEGQEKLIVERCLDEDITDALKVEANGSNLQYQWYKNETPISGAVENIYNIDRVDANTAGTYYVLVSNNCESKRSKDYEVRIKAPIVEQRWEDVMILITNPKDNGGHTFSDIQWYQVDTDGNQIEIPGATLSYYYSNTPVEGITYVAKATDQDRRLYESCPVTGVAYDPVEKILIYPNPVKMGETITIETHFSEDDGENMRIEIISSDGQKIKSLDVTNQNISIAMPNIQGIYILQLIKGRNVYEYKVVVK